jgi:pyruvate dehydrogenase E2 component (dihydrolipoamide acetyltransferase)
MVDDGAEVAVGDELVEIETDKANMVYEAEAAGILTISVGEGSTVPIGAPIALIGSGAAVREPASAPSGGNALAPTRNGTTTQTLTSVQSIIARRMVESKATMPDFTLTTDVDMTAVVETRSRLKETGHDVVPSVNDFVLKACAQTLRRHPRVNGAFRKGTFELYDRIMIGVAVAAEDALVVPVIGDADRKTLSDIARESQRLAEDARSGRLRPADLSGGTFTVSNLGMFGVTAFTAVLNPPQAAILAVGTLEARAVVVDGGLAVRARMTVTLTCDHRILYGADAAAFLRDVRRALEDPSNLLS